jgi:hypothetical protein
MAARTISINRAPVLSLWAAVVAQRLGFDEDEALTLGKALSVLNAQAKGPQAGELFSDCPVKVNGLRWPQFRHGPGIATPHGATQWLHPPIRDGQRGKGITNES